jgi:cell division septal protein FtsQ
MKDLLRRVLGGRGRLSRHEARNRRRGERARDHLERQRSRERSRLRERGRERERARHQSGERPHTLARLRASALFALSIGAGFALAAPVQRMLAELGAGEFGRVETVAIQGNERHSFEEIAAATGVVPGSALAEIDTAHVEQRLLGQHWIQHAHVLRLPPNTLLVQVSERRPVAVVTRLEDGSPWQLVDAEGTPFEPAGHAELEALPRLRSSEAFAPGESHETLRTALELVTALQRPALAGMQSAMEIQLPDRDSAEGWILRAREGSLEVVLGHDHLDERLDRLAQLLESKQSGMEDIVRIDLRFADRAVLRRLAAAS